MSRRVISYLLLYVIPYSYAQDDFQKSFSEFTTSAVQQYVDYSSKANHEFAEAIRQNWSTFEIHDARSRRRYTPGTDSIVVARPKQNASIDISDVPVYHKSERSVSAETNSIYTKDLIWKKETKYSDVDVDFYGAIISFSVPSDLSHLRMTGISERDVSRFWASLADEDTGSLISSIVKVQKEYSLNDWGLFELLQRLASSIYPKPFHAEKAVFCVFCMNQMNLRFKVARTSSSIIPIFPSEQEVYGRKYVEINGIKYYLADTDLNIAQLYSYDIEMNRSGQKVDMRVFTSPRFESRERSMRRVESSVLNTTISIPIDGSLISFYSDYPQTDVDIYALAVPDCELTRAISRTLKPILARYDGNKAIDILLSFVQNDFKYRTDTDQFGKEKPFFLEENFFYPYNDCEDRAVLFSHLVRTLLGYDCLLLEYSDHINCAVCTGEDVEGYYIRRGDRKYYVCDPSCQGATIGLSGKDYRTKPLRIWIL